MSSGIETSNGPLQLGSCFSSRRPSVWVQLPRIRRRLSWDSEFCIRNNIHFYPSKTYRRLFSITLAGIGFTAPLIFVVSLVQLSTPPLFIGITTALTISARTLGGTVGYAIAEAVYGSQTNDKVPAAIGKFMHVGYFYKYGQVTERPQPTASCIGFASGFRSCEPGTAHRSTLIWSRYWCSTGSEWSYTRSCYSCRQEGAS